MTVEMTTEAARDIPAEVREALVIADRYGVVCRGSSLGPDWTTVLFPVSGFYQDIPGDQLLYTVKFCAFCQVGRQAWPTGSQATDKQILGLWERLCHPLAVRGGDFFEALTEALLRELCPGDDRGVDWRPEEILPEDYY